MMTLFPESSMPQGGKAILLSIKPRFVDQILAGNKRVEFRRSWPSNDIGAMVLYSSSPIQRLVGVAYIDRIVQTDPAGLWELAQQHGGGLEYEELIEYFEGKKTAFGILIKSVDIASVHIDPKTIFQNFRPPQSYQYLSPEDYMLTLSKLFPKKDHV